MGRSVLHFRLLILWRVVAQVIVIWSIIILVLPFTPSGLIPRVFKSFECMAISVTGGPSWMQGGSVLVGSSRKSNNLRSELEPLDPSSCVELVLLSLIVVFLAPNLESRSMSRRFFVARIFNRRT
jgi:hypothetical protein